MERQFPLWMCFVIIFLIFLKCFGKFYIKYLYNIPEEGFEKAELKK